MKIRKVLNSSVVLVADGGEDFILVGKGIGYGRKSGEQITRQPSDRVFLPLSNPDAQQMIELFSSIPPEYLDITQEVVRQAEEALGTTLSPHIYLMLTDHLHFAVERQQQGIVITNRISWQIKNFYRREYDIGLYALELMRERLGVELPEDEAANVAFHIVNATKGGASNYDAMQAAKLIGNLVNIVTYTTHCKLDTESIHYSRFISHLQFFAERYFSGQTLDSDDNFLYRQMQTAYPLALSCAERIRTYLMSSDNRRITDEEVAYLAVHIARLTNEKG